MTTDGNPAPPGVLVDRYTIERCVGRGGMATVYAAHDSKHDRVVAVKILHPELASSLGAGRFMREIAIAARLAHPHILPLYDSGEAEGFLYYVMPFVTNESLRDRLRREKRLGVDEALRIGCQVASALDFAHRHHVVHRDIKPENILLQDGHAVVADFGIALAVRGSPNERLTSTGLMLGTPAYMSPEQVTGESTLDGRSDVFSLACVLYEVLAGEPPFAGRTAQAAIAKRLTTPPPRIRAVRADVPHAVEEVLLRGLATSPGDRFPTAEDFRRALETCQERAAPAAARGRVVRRAAAAAVAALVVALAVWGGLRPFLGQGTARTLAVLPLRSVSADPEYTYMADGLTDALTEMVRGRGVRVVAHTSAMRYATGGVGGMDMDMGGMGDDGSADMDGGMAPAGPPKSLTEIARDLHADIVMQGSFARTGDSVRVSATLVEPETQRTVWTETYVRHARELFALQEELAGTIVRIVGQSQDAQAPVEHVQSPEAHALYLKGSYFQAHWNLPQAIASFQQAVALDPTDAPAQAGLSRAYYFQAFFGDVAPAIALTAMRQAATAALEQDSLLAEAHAQMALVSMLQEWDWDAAERHFRRALELSPDHAQIRHDYAHFLLAQGRHAESLAETARAVALDPANPMLTSCLGWHSLFDRQHDRAITYAAEANAMMPDSWAQVVRGWGLLGKGEGDAALDALREATHLSGSAFAVAALAYGLAVSGKTEEARAVLDELLRRMEDEYVSPYDIATVYAGLGDGDETFRWLRRAAEERSTFIVHLAWDDRFERWRGDDRYRSLVERELRLRIPARS